MFNQERGISESGISEPLPTAPIFGSLSGTLTPGQTVPFLLGGTPPPFAVIFSDGSSGGQAITVTTVTASDLPVTTGLLLQGTELEEIISLIIPTLTATSVQVAISYIGADGSGVFRLQDIALSPSTPTSLDTPSTTTAATRTTSSIPSASTSIPVALTVVDVPKNLGAIIGGTIAGAVFLLFTLLLWIRRPRRLARSAGSPAGLHSANEESISPFVTDITETRTGTSVLQKTRGVGVAGSTSSGVTLNVFKERG
ncbi:hypothetical protein BDP27DRAFT_1338207 [Rhodocollybia butyracea]|uniref:Uncharacterized protein n=1 Tax=Rhodocollybia butyracea TaxID=206335 RepID=A0A9P5U0I3_9AGAR|nr:hypothetical protein BDP27DRAFT_1338207 [Rhodocollybia butyracea]